MSEPARSKIIRILGEVFKELRCISSQLKPKTAANSASRDNEDDFINLLIVVVEENFDSGIKSLETIEISELIRFYKKVKEFVTNFSMLPPYLTTMKIKMEAYDPEKQTITFDLNDSNSIVLAEVNFNDMKNAGMNVTAVGTDSLSGIRIEFYDAKSLMDYRSTHDNTWAVVKNWFNDDSSDLAISIGLGGRVSYITTKALEGGIIFDPKNNVVQALGLALLIFNPITAGIGLALMYANAEEVARYGSASGGLGTGFNLKDGKGDQKKGINFSFSGSISIGVWRSMEDFKGLSFASGGSGTRIFSVGGDLMYNKDNELIGVVVDLGLGTGAAEEAHLMTPAVTGIVELPNLEELIDIIEEKFSSK